MPIRKVDSKYYWGSRGPFATRRKALSVARAAYASGYRGGSTMAKMPKKKTKKRGR